jgi:hypothetical protein
MTNFLTSRAATTTIDAVGFIPLTATTADEVVFATSAEDPYRNRAVKRILKANAGPFTRAPDDSDELLEWLES